jgi:hypothetical protein
METEYKAAELQLKLEGLEQELISAREANQISQQQLRQQLASQDEVVEQRSQDVQTRLDEVLLELETTKGELATSGKCPRLSATMTVECVEHQLTP